MAKRRVQFVHFDGSVTGADTAAWTLRGILSALDIPLNGRDLYRHGNTEIWDRITGNLIGNLFDPQD